MSKLSRALSLLLPLTCIALASAILTLKFVQHRAEVSVPNLQGKTLSQARQEVAALHLRIRVADQLYSTNIPAGRVLNQSLAPGTTLPTGSHLRVTESLGPQTVQIPALTGKSDRAAIQQIHAAGLQLGQLAYLPTDSAPSGAVLAQSPPANAQNIAGPRIDLLIATPPTPNSATALVMPTLVGQTLARARAILAHAGLKLTRVKRIAVEDHPGGSILAQKPLSGYRVQPGDIVTLTVAQ